MSHIGDSVEGRCGQVQKPTTGYLRFVVAFWYQDFRINVYLPHFILFMCRCVSVCTREYSQRPEHSVRFSGTGAAGGFELPAVGAENRSLALHQSCECSSPLNHPSSSSQKLKSKHLRQLCTKQSRESQHISLGKHCNSDYIMIK